MPTTLLPLTSTLAASWWLPTNYSEHGVGIDRLFVIIFWICLAVLVGVHAILIASLIRYRHRRGQDKATFVHGNNRLEQVWTILPAILLTGLALESKRVWDGYVKTPPMTVEPLRVFVIGQQFKWNIVYPGPDGKLGRYLAYPKVTDIKWPNGNRFRGTNGPADVPSDKIAAVISAYIEQVDPLGKDFTDSDGDDDDWRGALGRDLVVPVNRPVEVYLSSRDVIHDFAVPNLRVKMDAVPGMVGALRFTATSTTAGIGPGYFDIVCDQLCGAGHYTMTARLFVVDDATYRSAIEQPTTKPSGGATR